MDNVEKTITQDEIVLELMKILKQNQMQNKANDVFEIASYIDGLQSKMDQVMEELATVKAQLSDIHALKENKSIRDVLKSMSDRMTIQCNHLKNQLFEVKTEFKEKAEQIVGKVKLKGKTALTNMNEFIGVKEKLQKMRMWVNVCKADAERMINKLDSLGVGMREATQGIANTLRTFADKEVIDYSSIEKKVSLTEMLKKPWMIKKTIFEGMELRIDAGLDKIDNLAKDIELSREKEKSNNAMETSDLLPVLAEKVEYQYGSESFEAQQKQMMKETVIDNNVYFKEVKNR